VRSGILGALLGSLWLATGTFFDSGNTLADFGRAFLGSIIYGSPVGLVVGVVLGAEIDALERLIHRVYKRARRSAHVWLVGVLASIVNVVMAGLLLQLANGWSS
jgi:hypothetical protein